MERIDGGIYSPGSQVSPENQLAAEFDVSRATVRTAMSVLAGRGLVTRQQGVGTFVSHLSGIANPLNDAVDFNELIAKFGFKPGVQFARAEMVAAGSRVAQALDIRSSDQILKSLKIFTALESRCGQLVDHHIANLRAETVRTAEFPNLPLDPNAPLLVIEEVAYSREECPLWHSIEYFPDSSMSFDLIRWRR